MIRNHGLGVDKAKGASKYQETRGRTPRWGGRDRWLVTQSLVLEIKKCCRIQFHQAHLAQIRPGGGQNLSLRAAISLILHSICLGRQEQEDVSPGIWTKAITARRLRGREAANHDRNQ